MKKNNSFAVNIFIAILLVGGFGNYLLTNTSGLFYVTVSQYFGVTRSFFSLYYSVQCLAAMITLLFSGRFLEKHAEKLKLIYAITVLMQFIGYMMFSRANGVWVFFVFGPIIGIAVAFNCLSFAGTLCSKWFAKGNGTILGIASAVSSIFGLYFAPVLTVMLAGDWRKAYMIIGFAVLILMFPATFLVKFTPEMEGRKPWGAEEVEESLVGKERVELTGVPFQVARKSASFYLIALMLFCATGASCFHFAIPGYIGELGFDAKTIGLVESGYLIGGLVGKLGGGWLMDKIGAIKVTIITTLCAAIGMLILIFSKADTALVLLIVSGALIATINFAIAVSAPHIAKVCFGSLHYANIFSKISTMIWLASMVMIPFYNFIYDSLGSYIPGMVFFIILQIVIVGSTIVAINKAKGLKMVTESELAATNPNLV